MDVSRISMAAPKVIDWRKLTAKDIIKYDSEGLNVPPEYLSWAKSFRIDLEKNDTDETTYEMAVSKPDKPQQNIQTQDSDEINTETPQKPDEKAKKEEEEKKTVENPENRIVQTVASAMGETELPGIDSSDENRIVQSVASSRSASGVGETSDVSEPQNEPVKSVAETVSDGIEQMADTGKVASTVQLAVAGLPVTAAEEVAETGQKDTSGQLTAAEQTKAVQEQNGTSMVNPSAVVAEGEDPEETTGQTEEEIIDDTTDRNLTAEQKRDQMKAEGEGDFSIAKAFARYSVEKRDAAKASASSVNKIGENSDNSIASLNSYMQDLLGQVNEVQSQINSLKNKSSNNKSNNMSKIQQLLTQLKSLGTTGQNTAIGYDTDLNLYQIPIDEGTAIGLDAQDYGDTTVDLSKEINGIFAVMRRSIENAGKDAVSAGENATDTSIMISDRNRANISTVHQNQSDIEGATGVSAEEVAQDNRNSQQNMNNQNANTTIASNQPKTTEKTGENKTAETGETSSEAASGKQQTAAQKAAKAEDNTSDAQKTDVEKKEEKIASGNLDEILKRKMRKGETV